MTYTPTYVKAYETALVQSRQNFILPADAYPILENAFVFRERIVRKSGLRLLGRLRRVLTAQALGNLDGAGNFSGNIRTILTLEATGEIEPGTLAISDGTNTFTDNGIGILVGSPAGAGTINYVTMDFTITGGAIGGALTASLNYFPGLPVMGLRSEELNDINNERMIAFDTKYAYRFVNGFQELIPGTTWTGLDFNFFWSTNYWVGSISNLKIFWVTNFSGVAGDPIRYTNTQLTAWKDFIPTINAGGDKLQQCLCIIPFRGRLMVFNTREGINLAASSNFRQRIRWAQIGNPFYRDDTDINTVFNVDAWRDDIPGKGGFLDIPTSEDIVSVGFVRDNLVIYCESSTWQLRYTGRSIAPFQIEKVNTELGAESTFSAVQFDTSLVGVGNRGIVECDSYSSKRIDIKIPDLVFRFFNEENGVKRVHGIRDFQQRIAYWCYTESDEGTKIAFTKFPNRRLVYNYENDSWGIFIDSNTCFGIYQPQSSLKWEDFPNTDPYNIWSNQSFAWNNETAQFQSIMGGNQQGFVEYLGQYNLNKPNTNDISLSIFGITGNDANPTKIKSIDHNLPDGTVIQIIQIPTGTPFSASLNDGIFGISVIDKDNFILFKYSSETQEFSIPQQDPSTDVYIGGGKIMVRDNFRIVSKKFNFLDEGQTIQFGYMDILMNNTTAGAITMNIYIDYNDEDPINTYDQNFNQETDQPDTFFNSVIPTYAELPRNSKKNWQRVYCNVRGSFITIEFTLSNGQLAGIEQESEVEIDAQILWMRKAGRQFALGV